MPLITSFGRFAAVTLITVTMSAVDSSAQVRGRFVEIQLSDSASAVVHMAPTDGSVTVLTPEGIFSLRADSSVLASWARASAALPGPVSGSRGVSTGQPVLSGSQLRATDESGSAMRLIRLSEDVDAAYHLTVSNGAWDYGVRVNPDRAPRLLAALTGRDAPELTWRDFRVAPEPTSGYHPARPASGNRGPKYPSGAELRRQSGRVQAQFAIGPDGRARRETLLIIRSTHPLFALAVRDAIPSMRFAPATRDGIPVADTVVQQFEFRVP
jgi:TonB family protein